MFCRCRFTVLRLMLKEEAMSLLIFPCPIRANISFSLSLKRGLQFCSEYLMDSPFRVLMILLPVSAVSDRL